MRNPGYNELTRQLQIVDDDQLLTVLREKYNQATMVQQVTITSGPGAVGMGLFNTFFYEKNDIDALVGVNAFSSYQLADHFRSTNGLPMHSKAKDYSDMLKAEAGEANDLSWLEVGEHRIQSKEKRLISATTQLQYLSFRT